VRVISLARNSGQTAALACGFAHATGDVVIAMDADGQNDPADIPRLLAKLDEGYDLASGWRTERWQAERFTRRLPSMAANSLISAMTGVKLHDYGCTFKAYRRELARSLSSTARCIDLSPRLRRSRVRESRKSKSDFGRAARAPPSMDCGA